MKNKDLRVMAAVLVCILAAVVFMGCQVEGPDNKSNAKTDAKGVLTNIVVDKDRSSSRSTAGDKYENDDNYWNATPIDCEMNSQEHNFADDAIDWYKFKGVQGRAYIIETTVFNHTDTILTLYRNNQGNEIARHDDISSGNRGSKIEWLCDSSTDTFYLKCESFQGDTGADEEYNIIMVDPSVGFDSYEDDDTADKAKSISIYGDPQVHNFRTDAVDWVTFYVYSGYTYIIETNVNGDETVPEEKRADTKIFLYDSKTSENEIAVNDDINKGWNRGSRIVYSPTTSGRRYLKVIDYHGAGPNKNYSLSVIKSKLLNSYEFEGSTNGWDDFKEHGADSYLSRDNNMLKVNVANPGTVDRSLGVFKNRIKLEKGKTYTFLFDAKTRSGEKDIYVGFEKNSAPYTKYCSFRYYRLNNTGMTTYRSTFTMNHTTDNYAQFMFYFGKKSGDTVSYPTAHWLDNVRIYENE